jgi:homoserine kinase
MIALACDGIALPESGGLELYGLRAEVMFYKEAFKLIDVKADVLKMGKYKSAVEPYLADKMSDEKLLQLATEMEGHPDNVAAALYGNAVVAWQEDQHGKDVAQAISLSVDTRIRAIAFIPSTAVATSKARKMLPEMIPHRDAARNSANSALLVHALTLRPDLLFRATQDFLHQSYRQDAMPASFAFLTKLRGAGVAAFISGAGPTVLALHTGNESDVAELIRAAGTKFEAKSLEIARSGAAIL